MPNLLNLNLFGLDMGKWLTLLAEKKRLLLMAVVITVAFIGAIVLFKSNTDQLTHYRNQIQQAYSKIDLINQYNSSKKELQQRTSILPTLSLSNEMFVNQLIDYAVQNHIDVTNFIPKPMENKNFYNATSVSLSIHTDNFKNLIAFMYAVERSPYLFRIESWTGESKEGSETIECKMDISYIQGKI